MFLSGVDNHGNGIEPIGKALAYDVFMIGLLWDYLTLVYGGSALISYLRAPQAQDPLTTMV